MRSEQSIDQINTSALDARLNRVARGELNSAVDEFMESRIPIQLGTMTDPFSPIERKRKVTADVIRTLNKYNYPFVTSTRGDVLYDGEIESAINDSNSVHRFSISTFSDALRREFETGAESLRGIGNSIYRLSRQGKRVLVRLQPVLLWHEDQAREIIRFAAECGAHGVSAEYLKVPLEKDAPVTRRLSELYGQDIRCIYRDLGSSVVGREYILPLQLRKRGMDNLQREALAIGIEFYHAELELLHLNRDPTCCNGSSSYLDNAKNFQFNMLGAVRQMKIGHQYYFDDLFKTAGPFHSIDNYLNSRSRKASGVYSWRRHMKERWNRGGLTFSPETFMGVNRGVDERGETYYIRY